MMVQLFADGWYRYQSDARAILKAIENQGATPVGIIKSAYGTWGLLYWNETVLFQNHVINGKSALASVVRKGLSKKGGIKDG